MDASKLQEFARNYTAAWCSQDAARVAGFFAEEGSLTINEGDPSVGRPAITAAAQAFMTAFPDMVVAMDEIHVEGSNVVYRWTLTGTNTGPEGTGQAVCIRGHEEWRIGADGLIAESKGHFDEREFNRQLKVSTDMQIWYLEIVTNDVDAVCAAYAAANGLQFGDADATLGNARTAALPGGGLVGVRAPLREAEGPVVRPYWLVADIAAEAEAAVAAGAQLAVPPMEIPGHGTCAIYIAGGVEHGLWQR